MVNITLTPNATGYASNLTVVQKNFNHKADISLTSTYIIFATCGGVFILCILLTIITKGENLFAFFLQEGMFVEIGIC